MSGSDGSSPHAPVLVAEDVRKSYGRRQALRGLTFTLQPGHVLGFLGPNGAGKTTAIRILTTILQPTSGRFSVDGIDHEHPAQIRPRIGVLPESLGLPNQITGVEYIGYFARLYGGEGADVRSRALALLELVGLRDRATHLIRTYSHGMRQRLGLARSLVNDPVVLFLDEPTLGLDPRGQYELLSLIRSLAGELGVGVILCSHVLSQVEGVCDDVVILSAGRMVAAGSVGQVLARAREQGARRDAVRVRVPESAVGRTTELLAPLASVAQMNGGGPGGRLEVSLAPPIEGNAVADQRANEVLDVLVRAGIPVLGFEIEGNSLQDAFLQLTEGERG